MARQITHVLEDMLQAIDRLEEITKNRTFSDFTESWQMRWLVQRGIQVVSEASRAIPAELKNSRPEIPWAKVGGIGNVLRHEYHALSDPILWRVVTDELPRLKTAVQALIAQADDG
jgi:uncharacterized protein with HEPN domain